MHTTSLFIASLFTLGSLADADVTLSDLTYTDDGSSVTITDCLTSASGALVIPDTIDGLPVTAIGDSAFRDCTLITSAVVPEGIETMGERVFFNCDDLASASLPDSLTSIGRFLFSRSESLSSVTIPSGISVVPDEILTSCTGLTSVIFEEGITQLGNQIFIGCDNLQTLSLPSTLQSIVNPSSSGDVYYLGSFYDTPSLTNINVTAGGNYFASYNGAFYTADYAELLIVPSGYTGTLTMHGDTTSNAAYAFHRCDDLSSIHFSYSMTTISGADHYECDSLTSFTVGANNVNFTALDGVIFSADETQLVAFPPAKSGSYSIPDGVTSIQSYAFGYCDDVTSITTPDSISSIASHAFYNASGLLSATINGSLTELPDYCFYKCTSLESITMSASTHTLGDACFDSCRALSNIGCSNIKQIGTRCFGACFALTEIDFHSEISELPDSCFYSAGLTSFSIPTNVISIGDDAFSGCDLASISLNNGLLSIGEEAFSDTNLSSLYIPGSVTSIGEYAFYDSNYLESIEFGEGVTSVDYSAFAECYALKSVILPTTLTSLKGYAFYYCEALEYVIFKGNAPTLTASNNFDDTHANLTLYYYSGATGFSSQLDGIDTQSIYAAAYPAAEWLVNLGYNPLTDINEDISSDGVPLIVEYGLNLDPTANNSDALPSVEINSSNAEMTYYAGASGVLYEIEQSSNLSDWSTSGVTLSSLDSQSLQTASLATGDDSGFLRLTIKLPPIF